MLLAFSSLFRCLSSVRFSQSSQLSSSFRASRYSLISSYALFIHTAAMPTSQPLFSTCHCFSSCALLLRLSCPRPAPSGGPPSSPLFRARRGQHGSWPRLPGQLHPICSVWPCALSFRHQTCSQDPTRRQKKRRWDHDPADGVFCFCLFFLFEDVGLRDRGGIEPSLLYWSRGSGWGRLLATVPLPR